MKWFLITFLMIIFSSTAILAWECCAQNLSSDCDAEACVQVPPGGTCVIQENPVNAIAIAYDAAGNEVDRDADVCIARPRFDTCL